MSGLPEPQDLDAMAQAKRRAQGKQAVFLADPAVVRVLSIAMANAGELSVARERTDTLERLLLAKGLLGADDIERYAPDAAVQAARNEWGRAYFARVLRLIDQDAQAMASAPEPSLEPLGQELGRSDVTPLG